MSRIFSAILILVFFHVTEIPAQASGGELVENTFEPYYRAKEQKKKSNLLDTLNEGVE